MANFHVSGSHQYQWQAEKLAFSNAFLNHFTFMHLTR